MMGAVWAWGTAAEDGVEVPAPGMGFYVGKEVSADGTTMLGRMVESASSNSVRHVNRVERGKKTHFDGSTNKYAFICVSYTAGMNEKGVMMSAPQSGRTKEAARESDPFTSVEAGGVGETNLPDYLIGNAATAREAVELLGQAIADHGHAGPDIYAIADSNETWYVEVYTGRQWAAVRMPEDRVSVYGNQFNIRDFKTNDVSNVMYSPDIVGLAERGGFVVWADEQMGIIDLQATYSSPLIDNSNYRTYLGHHSWAPSTYGDPYETTDIYPLCFDPDFKVSITNVFELMRTRDDTLDTTKQTSCQVLQMRHDLPADYRCTLWECPAQADHSTFLPVCMAVKNFPDAWAADAFVRLAAFAETNRLVVAEGLSAYWKAQEDRLVVEWPQKLEEWVAAQEDAGCVAATAYVDFQELWTLADAKRLYDEAVQHCVEFGADSPIRPFSSSVPTNAATGVTWTEYHRSEFDAYVEKLAGVPERRPPSVSVLVDTAKHALDNVEDEVSLNAAKARLQEIVASLYEEAEKSFGVPVIVSFVPDFTQGSTSEVPNVSWKIKGPFDQVTLSIDEETVYDGDTRCGEGRWRDLCRPGTHRLRLDVRHGDQDVVSSCFYTALLEDAEPAALPMIGHFYPDFYVGQKGETPIVHWDTSNITTLEIWVDGVCVLMTDDEIGEFRFSQLRNVGTHIVRMVAHNVVDDAEASFAYRTEAPATLQSSPAPSLQTAGLAPVIREFRPDAYDASIWETPDIHWELDRAVDSLQMKIDNVPVFMGDGRVGNGRWSDLSRLNIDSSNGLHTVTLSVSNAFGVATSNFTYTCHWMPPPPPPQGSEANPWQVGETVQAYTNGVGGLVFIGEGATYDFPNASDVPWSEVVDSIESVEIPDALTTIGKNLWAGLGGDVTINGESIVRRKQLAAGFPVETPGGEISGGEFERIKIVNGIAFVTIGVYTNAELTATIENWGKARIENVTVDETGAAVLSVPVPANKGFMILKSKPTK